MLDTAFWVEWYSVDVGVSTVEYGPGSGGEDSEVACCMAPPPSPTGLLETELWVGVQAAVLFCSPLLGFAEKKEILLYS